MSDLIWALKPNKLVVNKNLLDINNEGFSFTKVFGSHFVMCPILVSQAVYHK